MPKNMPKRGRKGDGFDTLKIMALIFGIIASAFLIGGFLFMFLPNDGTIDPVVQFAIGVAFVGLAVYVYYQAINVMR